MRPSRITALVFLLGLPAMVAAQQPTRTSIVLDGSFDDWQTVFANPFNTIFDGDGSTIPCQDSSDRDCIVSSSTSDVRRFAFTWDDQNLYFFVERFTAANNKSFIVYLDRDADGFLEESTSDWALVHDYKASQNQITPARHLYDAAGGGGSDRIVDALGFGDGYDLPGGPGNDVTGGGDPSTCTTCNSADGLAFEFAWPWSVLGMTPGQAFQYHVSGTTSSGSTPDDNMAGRFGREGSSVFFLFDAGAKLEVSAPPGLPLYLPHPVENTGNAKDQARLRVVSSLGNEICLHHDADADGTPDVLIACDKKGDGDYIDNGDFIDPTFDVDGDTLPETPKLDPGQVFSLLVELHPSNNSRGKIDLVDLEAASLGNLSIDDHVVDEIAVGDVAMFPPRERLATPGVQVPLSHRIDSHLGSSETFSVSVATTLGWTVTLHSDPDGDGDPSDGSPLFDTTGDTVPDVTIPAQGTFHFVALTSVPADATLGERETIRIGASASGALSTEIEDSVTVSPRLELSPSYLESEGRAKAGSATYPVFFRHTVTWAGAQPEAVDLISISSQGYAIDYFTDPNGDGNPSDGVLLTEPVTTPVLDAFGGSFDFLLRVTIPQGAVPGALDSTDVFALAQSNSATNDTVRDQTRVTLIQAFKDEARTLSLTHTPACSTLHARATGLVPSQSNRYRILWENSAGASIKITPFSTDAQGEGFDSLDVVSDAPLGLWGVAIQELQSGTWVELDRWFFEVQNPGTLDVLSVEPSPVIVVDDSLTVRTVFRNNSQADLGPLELHFRILTPTGDRYLTADGSFQPYTGAEETWVTSVPALIAGDSHQAVWTVSGISWAETGFHSLEVSWVDTCGGSTAGDVLSFLLDGDYDGDGLDDLDEQNAGLDPLDRDTDDDGLLDGADGLADTDGDTLPDGLDCDADGDGLEDGLEAGVTASTADPDTDTDSSCFVEDGDAGATTTDPHLADTDGGGLEDGIEDADGDGVVDPGEGDPNDPSDDSCAPEPPEQVRGLALERKQADVLLTWDVHPDLCVTYRVYSTTTPEDPAAWGVVAEDVPVEEHLHTGIAGEGTRLRAWLILAVSPVAGDGDLGHFGGSF